MAEVHLTLREHGNAALAALDTLKPADHDPNEELANVMRRLLAMRDELIAAGRRGEPCASELRRTNAILSSIFGMEFPSEGLQWKRVCETRDALRALLAQLPAVSAE